MATNVNICQEHVYQDDFFLKMYFIKQDIFFENVVYSAKLKNSRFRKAKDANQRKST